MARTVVKDRKEYRIWNVVDKVWHRLNFLTNANSVDASDGKTLQTKVGAIDGITSDVNGESERIAASIKCVNRLNNSLVSNIYVGSDGKLHKVIGGADTVLPFSSTVRCYTVLENANIYGDKFIKVYIEKNGISTLAGTVTVVKSNPYGFSTWDVTV